MQHATTMNVTQISNQLSHYHLCLNSHFAGEPVLAGPPSVHLHLFQKKTVRNKWHRFLYRLDTLQVTQPTVSKLSLIHI